MRFLPLHGRRILRSHRFHLNPLGTVGPPRSPPPVARPPRREHPPPRGWTRKTRMSLEPASPSIRLGCELLKHARSVVVGKPRFATPSINPFVMGSNDTGSAMANHHASGARTEGWSVNMPTSAECVDRIKSRARTVIAKKIPSTPLANRQSIHHPLQRHHNLYLSIPIFTLNRVCRRLGVG